MIRSEAKAHIKSSLEKQGISWSQFTLFASQIIVYGSCVFGLSHSQSDIDLLLIGTDNKFRPHNIDIKWIEEADCCEPTWLQSELATHIAAYGCWTHGQDNWSSLAQITSRTLEFKVGLISSRVEGLYKRYSLLNDEYRKKHALKIRRDLQRYYLLSIDQPVIATSILDYSWSKDKDKKASLSKLIDLAFAKFDVDYRSLKPVFEYVQLDSLNTKDSSLSIKIDDWLSSHLSGYEEAAWSKVNWSQLSHQVRETL